MIVGPVTVADEEEMLCGVSFVVEFVDVVLRKKVCVVHADALMDGLRLTSGFVLQ